MTEPHLDEEQARQGETGFGMRWVLVISVVAAIAAMGLLFSVFLGADPDDVNRTEQPAASVPTSGQ